MLSSLSLLQLLLLAVIVTSKDVIIRNDKCRYCTFLADTFNAGLEKTANKHFAGGDTAWEEKNLGKYKTSETRLVEVMEGVCKKKTLKNIDKYSILHELEFKCSALFEENEEAVEEWYKGGQSLDLFSHLCVDLLKICCPAGRWGEACASCPGIDKGAAVCYGHGDCHGDGSREGTGKCKCSSGYTGHSCQHCHSNYFAVSKTDNTIECTKCDESCAGGCNGLTAKDCVKCATGWLRDEQEGCVDVDECKAEGDNERCKGSYEICVNTIGSYKCDCDIGYVRNKEGLCEVDVVARNGTPSYPVAKFLRQFAYGAMFLCCLLILLFHRTPCSFLLIIITVILSIYIELYINVESFAKAEEWLGSSGKTK